MNLSADEIKRFTEYAKKQLKSCEVAIEQLNNVKIQPELKRFLLKSHNTFAASWMFVAVHLEGTEDRENQTNQPSEG